jgi:hypothetical protein
MSLYSGGAGRLLRQANVQRANELHKVPMQWGQLRSITEASYRSLCAEPRPFIKPAPVNVVGSGAISAWGAALREACKPPRRLAPAARKTCYTDAAGRLLLSVRRQVAAHHSKFYAHFVNGDWIRVGAALNSTGASDALQLWEEFSSGHPKHRPGECAARWEGLSADRVSLGTLRFLAKGARA